MSERVLLRRDVLDSRVAVISLNRPDAANAIDLQMANDLLAVTLDIAADTSVRAVVLRAEGPVFCGGGDLKTFVEADDMPKYLRAVTVPLHAALRNLLTLDAPVFCAVRGFAAGAGLSLACAADVVVAASSATFHLAYTAAGLSPDGGASWLLPRLIGVRRTLQLAVTNRPLGAQQALEWGLISEIVPDENLDDSVFSLAREAANGATAAFGRTKQLVWTSLERSMPEQMEAEASGLMASARTHDGVEGVRAFVEKRKPDFLGR